MPGLRELLKELRSVADAAASPANPSDTHPEIPYLATDRGLILLKVSETGVVPVPLANFTAQIVAEQIRDDGTETQRFYEIESRVNDRIHRFSVPSGQFSGMAWVADHLDAQAVIYPGFALKDHARAAIQLLSNNVVTRQVLTHSGWREVNRNWAFLHGGGAICPTGPLHDVTIDLPESLRRFELPDPPTGEDLRSAIRASIEFLDVAGDPVTVPIFCAIWRSVLGGADFSLHLSGTTGAGKSELAALAQQHFGAGMVAKDLPANWSSTANFLEALAFSAKDVLLVVDDFAPTGSPSDVQRLHRDADRLLRAQGNLSARQRMRRDTYLLHPKPPRGLILSTGEDIPRGQSLRARLVVLILLLEGAGSVNWPKLTVCQRYATTGTFSRAMSGFLRWLDPQYREMRNALPQLTADLAAMLRSNQQHQRTPYNVASLALGMDYLLRFAADVEALSAQEIDDLSERVWRALVAVVDTQGEYQSDSEPTGRFLRLLSASIASGQAHFAAPNGLEPSSPESWGWRKVVVGFIKEWRPQGRRIGWVEGGNLYLQSEAAYAEAQRMARDEGDALTITLPTLKKRLKEGRLLASTQSNGGKERLEVRRVLEKNRRSVLHLHASTLVVHEVHQVHHDGSGSPIEGCDSDSYHGAPPTGFGGKVYQESESHPAADTLGSQDDGALGTLFEGIPPEPLDISEALTINRIEPWDDFPREVGQ
jgi:hypothetical protein